VNAAALTRLLSAIALFTLLPCAVRAGMDFPPPPDAKTEWVAQDMELNNIAMKIRRFESDHSVQQVLGFYRERWRAGGDYGGGFAETDAMEPWIILSRVENQRLYTVQVQSHGARGSWGYLGESDLPALAGKTRTQSRFPAMSNSTVLNDIVNRDTGSRGRTLLLSNGYSVESNASFYRSHFRRQGWTADMDQTVETGRRHVLAFRNGPDTVNLVITDAGDRTNVIAGVTTRELIE